MPMMWNVDIVLGLFVVVDGVDHFTGRIGVIGSTALFQLFRFHVQIRIFVQIKQLFLHFLYHLSASAALIVFTHFNRQHLFWLKVVEQIGTRDQAQRTKQSFAKG